MNELNSMSSYYSFWLLQTLLLFCCTTILALNPLTDYTTASFPCDTKCASMSSATCFANSWSEPAKISRDLTRNCRVAVYSLSLGQKVAGLPNIYDFWNNQPCSIMFLSSSSEFAMKNNITTFDRIKNWTIVILNPTFPEYSTFRRAGKVPKFIPSAFLSPKVTYGVYLDSKYNLYTSPVAILRNWTLRHSDTIITAVGHPVNTAVEGEIKLIGAVRVKSRPTVTEDFSMIERQYEAYNSTGLFQKMLQRGTKQPFMEAGMLFHKVHDHRSVVFLCSWLEQVQRYSDRDQIAFPFVAGWYNNHLPFMDFQDYHLVPLKFDRSYAYINVLSKKYYWMNERRFGEQTYEAWHHTVPVKSQKDQ
jgi:hypothetical protein